MKINGIKNDHLDVFKELGNIGAGNATTALSKLLNKPIKMAVPQAKIVTFSEITDIVGKPDDVVVSGLIEIFGELTGFVMLLNSEADAITIVKSLLGEQGVPSSALQFDEMHLSVLTEVTNILIGSYITAIAMTTGLSVSISTPQMAVDMAAAVLSVPAIEYGKVGDAVLFMETKFEAMDTALSGHFFLVPDVDSTEKMLRSLGMEVDE